MVELADHLEVLPPAEKLVDRGVLPGQTGDRADGGSVADGVVTANGRLPGVGREQRRQNPYQGGLARTVRSEQRQDPPGFSAQVDPGQRDCRPEGLSDALDLDHRAAATQRRCPSGIHSPFRRSNSAWTRN
jgi:hypothetical protein